MRTLVVLLSLLFVAGAFAQKGWYPHEGSVLKYRVNIRFGQEPETMPKGWYFGRVSAVATDSQGDVYVFHRGTAADLDVPIAFVLTQLQHIAQRGHLATVEVSQQIQGR